MYLRCWTSARRSSLLLPSPTAAEDEGRIRRTSSNTEQSPTAAIEKKRFGLFCIHPETVWRPSVPGFLLVGISQLDQDPFRIRTSCKLKTSGQLVLPIPHRDSNGREACVGDQPLAIVTFVFFFCFVIMGGRIGPGWVNQRVQLGIVHCLKGIGE